MIRLADWEPGILRRINLRLFEDPAFPYDLDSVAGFEPQEALRRRIVNMKDSKIRPLLLLAKECPLADEEGFRVWWAHWMPIAAGSQIWPDGNHRTGMMVAELVAEAAGFTILLEADTMTSLRRESKAIIQERWRHAPPVVPDEFADPAHPLAKFYQSFRHRLVVKPSPEPLA